MDDKGVQIFYDHYKDSFENLKAYLQKRNNYSLIAIMLVALLTFQISNPDQAFKLINGLIVAKIGHDIIIEYTYINSLLLFVFLWVVMMYFQLNLLIERLYQYIHGIEVQLTDNLTPFSISREGKSYLGQYPWFSTVVHKIYTIGFPAALLIVLWVKWSNELAIYNDPSNGHFLFDTFAILGIAVLTLLYLSKLHFNDFKEKLK